MKALIICNDDDAFVKMEKVLLDAHYEIIRYKHLLKALDNIEEIQSDVVIISAEDYPRHWKTFSQYAKSGVAGKIPKIILYAPLSLQEDEQKKAAELVKGTFSSCTDEGLENLLNILLETEYIFDNDFESEQFADNQFEENQSSETSYLHIQSLIFNEPKSNFIITGSVKNIEDKLIQFIPDNLILTKNIFKGDKIEKLSYKANDSFYTCYAIVKDSSNDALTLELGI